jgi:hypothetical protein
MEGSLTIYPKNMQVVSVRYGRNEGARRLVSLMNVRLIKGMYEMNLIPQRQGMEESYSVLQCCYTKLVYMVMTQECPEV